MTIWHCYYHVVWATKYRAAIITKSIEPVLLETIRSKSTELECSIIALNTVWDHVHVAVCIPPKLSVAKWVKDVKGASANKINLAFPMSSEPLRWQAGYSVHTFGRKQVDYVANYVYNQKEHHAHNTIVRYLEELDE